MLIDVNLNQWVNGLGFASVNISALFTMLSVRPDLCMALRDCINRRRGLWDGEEEMEEVD